MDISTREARSILTPQQSGFLTTAPYPFTHSLSAYVGCGFGQTSCGKYCYAQYLPQWIFNKGSAAWGKAVQVKTNAAELLEKVLRKMKPTVRRKLRIFMSTTTDPYQPIERKYQVTRRCLEVFTHYPDLDLLVVQTRSPLAERDLPLLRQIPYAWLSVTIETDDQAYLQQLGGGPPLERRWQLVHTASKAGVPVQITVSPCLPYSDMTTFAQRLLESGAKRLVVDTVVDGDGSLGKRTAHSPFAQAEHAWAETSHAHRLYHYLCDHIGTGEITIGWSSEGFCSIASKV
jgi:DNA repair photolyase